MNTGTYAGYGGTRVNRVLVGLAAAALLVGLPLIGVAINGDPVSMYLEFPPLTQHVRHAPFSWIAFCILAAGIAAALAPFVYRALRHRQQCAAQSAADAGGMRVPEPPSRVPHSAFRVPRFPSWGWAALVFGIAAWVLAWKHFDWFAPLQRFTFSPLWFAYIATVNALTFRRTGHCLLIDRPRYMLGLFAASAVFWWYFEYLNRFVQNWYYVNCEGLTAPQYFVFATLPFSTVLPAVMSTAELLESFPRFAAGLTGFRPVTPARPRVAASLVLAAAAAGLALLATWPSYLFPLLWLSPLLVLASLDTLAGRTNALDATRRGDWTAVARFAVAALICGLFWEMWNFWSLAKWRYSVPFVQKFHIFEMPILGYAGYLPFGLECAIIAERVARWTGDPADPSDLSHGTGTCTGSAKDKEE
jgi:hypothetical protein